MIWFDWSGFEHLDNRWWAWALFIGWPVIFAWSAIIIFMNQSGKKYGTLCRYSTIKNYKGQVLWQGSIRGKAKDCQLLGWRLPALCRANDTLFWCISVTEHLEVLSDKCPFLFPLEVLSKLTTSSTEGWTKQSVRVASRLLDNSLYLNIMNCIFTKKTVMAATAYAFISSIKGSFLRLFSFRCVTCLSEI